MNTLFRLQSRIKARVEIVNNWYTYHRIESFHNLSLIHISIIKNPTVTLTVMKEKSRIVSGNMCYYAYENLLKSRILSKQLKVTTYRIHVRSDTRMRGLDIN